MTVRELLAQNTSQSQLSSFFTDNMKVYSVTAYGAKGDGVSDDTTAVQAAITAWIATGGVLVFPGGKTYNVTGLTMSNPPSVGAAIWAWGATIKNTSTSGAHLLQTKTTDSFGGAVDSIQIYGGDWIGNSLSGDGLHLAASSNNDNNENITIDGGTWEKHGGHGIYVSRPILTRFLGTRSRNNGGEGFHLIGDGTSCSFVNTYSSGNTGKGYYMADIVYSGFTNTAADGNAYGYYIDFVNTNYLPVGLSWHGCGAESNTTASVYVNSAESWEMSGCSFTGATYGVQLYGARHGKFSACYIHGTGSNEGIYLAEATSPAAKFPTDVTVDSATLAELSGGYTNNNLALVCPTQRQAWLTATPVAPASTGSAAAVTNTNLYPVTIFQTGGTGLHIISAAGTDNALPGGSQDAFTLEPGDQVYVTGTTSSSWKPYGL